MIFNIKSKTQRKPLRLAFYMRLEQVRVKNAAFSRR